jgi:transcriptional regulator with GAF, ATPase, and Fis domain
MKKNDLIREVTLRLYQCPKIEDSLFQALCFLHKIIPMDNLHAGVYDKENGYIWYLASATLNGGSLKDEKIRLTQKAFDEIDTYCRPGKALVFNRPLETQTIKELMEIQVAMPENRQVYNPGTVFSAMTLTVDLGEPLYGLCTMVSAEPERYSKKFSTLFECLTRPLTGAILNLLHHRQILNRNEQLELNNQELRHRLGFSDAIQIIGAESGLKNEMIKASQVANTDTPVLITGETGTGKEVMAHAIHRMSTRRNGPMVCVNCGAIPETLVDSELFGHEKGAFTGADKKKRGYFEQATGGTIFLDEVAELTASAQVKLLRVLQEKTLFRLGGNRPISVDIRVIAATHRELPRLVEQRLFREDLWFRLNVFPIHIPPLRDRKQDIPNLVDYLMTRKSKEMHLPFIPRLADGSIESMMAYAWPGNIREIDNLVERNLIICNGNPLTFPELKQHYYADGDKNPSAQECIPLDKLIIEHIKKALELSNGKISGKDGAARLLGINPSTLRGKMRKYKINLPR